jgi:DMSO/TMAO reductase YedYZ molybdopterin-dependent catalytic subunit
VRPPTDEVTSEVTSASDPSLRTGRVDPSARRPARPGPFAAAVAGVVGAGVALGVGELIAGLDGRFTSPVESVATQTIDSVPLSVERFAIETFGKDDKLALVVGILVVSAVLGAVLGVASRRRPWVGTVGLAAFALVGVAAALARPRAEAMVALPSLAAGLAGVMALRVLVPRATAPRPDAGPDAEPDAEPDPDAERRGGLAGLITVTRGGVADRRSFLTVTTAAAAGAALAGVGGRRLRGRFSAAGSRAQVRLPAAARRLPPVPGGVEVGVDGVAPFVTPNRDFYRVDTALVTPQVRAEDWTLRVAGMVDRPFELTYAELLDRDLVEVDITMTCVSNLVGGDLVGTARWLGVLTRELLDEAGVRRGADQLVGRSTDGYTCGFPVEAAYDRNCLVAVGMNGEPLPIRHGFPARLVTPGVYGYIGSTKWLTELEVTTFDAFDQYWVRRGYADRAPIKTMARIDAPSGLRPIRPGPTAVAGVAWAQTRGIDGVEVRVDDGRFAPAELADALNDETWRQWRFAWDATPGRHTLTVRATDGTGETQTDERTDVVPDGANGWMSLVVLVDEAA